MSKLYKIRVTQTLVFEDFVEADSLDEARTKQAWCDQDTHKQELSSHTQEVTEATDAEHENFFG